MKDITPLKKQVRTSETGLPFSVCNQTGMILLLLSFLLYLSDCTYPLEKKVTAILSEQRKLESFTPPLEQLWRKSIYYAPASHFQLFQGLPAIANRQDRIFILNPYRGKIIYKVKTKRGIDGNFLASGRSFFYITALPLQGRVYKKTLSSWRWKTLRQRWRSSSFSPLEYQDKLICTNQEGYLAILKKEDLSILQEKKFHFTLDLQPLLYRHYVIMAARQGTVYFINLQNYMLEKKLPVNGNWSLLSLQKEYLFLGSGDGDFIIYSLQNGEMRKLQLQGRIQFSPSMFDSLLAVTTLQAKLYLITLQGEVVEELNLDYPAGTSVVILNGYLIWGDLGHYLNVMGLRSRKIVWKKELHGRVRTTPFYYNGILLVGSEDQYIYGFQRKQD